MIVKPFKPDDMRTIDVLPKANIELGVSDDITEPVIETIIKAADRKTRMLRALAGGLYPLRASLRCRNPVA